MHKVIEPEKSGNQSLICVRRPVVRHFLTGNPLRVRVPRRPPNKVHLTPTGGHGGAERTGLLSKDV